MEVVRYGGDGLKRDVEAAELESAIRALFIYFEDASSKEALERDEVMTLVHKLNEAYLNWAVELDNAKLTLLK